MSVALLIAERNAWAQTLAPDQARGWLDFYAKYFATNEGRAHLEWVDDGKRVPYLEWMRSRM